MQVRQLITRIGFKVDDSKLKDVDSKVADFKKHLLRLGVATTAVVGGLYFLTKGVANIGDATAKMAQSLGFGVEALQELQYAADISGVSADEFNSGMMRLARNISDASHGLETSERAFTSLGISIKNQDGTLKSTDAILMEVSEKFRVMPDGTKKTALAMEMFGRSGARLIPMLNEGAAGIEALRKEAQELGFVMDEEATKQSEEFNDAITRMNKAFLGVRVSIAKVLMPIFIKLFTKIKDITVYLLNAYKSLSPVMQNAIKIIAGLGVALLIIVPAVMAIISAIGILKIGLIALGITSLAAGAKMALAWIIGLAPIIGIVALITAIIALVALLADDIYTFFAGGESVTGYMVDAFKRAKDVVLGYFTEIWDYIKGIGEWFSGMFRRGGEALGLAATPTVGGGAVTNVGGANVSVSAPIEVNVPEGTPPHEVAESVRIGVSDSFDKILRQSNASLASVEAF